MTHFKMELLRQVTAELLQTCIYLDQALTLVVRAYLRSLFVSLNGLYTIIKNAHKISEKRLKGRVKYEWRCTICHKSLH